MQYDPPEWNPPPQPGDESPFLPMPPAAHPPSDEPDGALPSWERRRELGIGSAWIQTIIEVLARPTEVFSRMRPEGDLGGALAFSVATQWAIQSIGILIGLALSPFTRRLQSALGVDTTPLEGMMHFQTLGAGVLIVTMPLMILVYMLVGAGILHVLLLVVGGANRSFETTLKVVAYGGGATVILGLVPLCGALLRPLGLIIVLTIGLSRVHRTDTWRALVAVLVPLLLAFICCCGCIAAVALLAAGSPELQEALNQFQLPQ